ncbi:hypothetical protein X727_12515 [Mesorhizobium sp. L103C119B0]|uniref:hypothetical protein n=1 Tax=Mesorhizobium sp. L103C119B0 TaxID=1287085 RepID=UPI0003CFABAE|nr:hypothetical protein [Mesorhizobium sp. L103C119B0]ESZ70677.1 hypothetical protein X727_12515 [Mesorhizobium sp. L103C119B0]
MADTNKSADEVDLTDGRDAGQWRSRYPMSAWCQIGLELVYLLTFLALAGTAILYLGICISNTPKGVQSIQIGIFNQAFHRQMIDWVLVVLSGAVGGLTFDLKWLYHSVAHGFWSRDRVLWRLLVPLISGVVSVFLAFIIVSGLVPFVKNESFRTTYFSLGFGFLFGYFSDNVIAALQNFAQRYIGTTRQDDSE